MIKYLNMSIDRQSMKRLRKKWRENNEGMTFRDYALIRMASAYYSLYKTSKSS